METKERRMRDWLIAISILASLLFLVDIVLAFTIISESVEHLRMGSKNISPGGDITAPYSLTDFHSDLEVEIPVILVSLIVVAAGPVGGWMLRRRKPGVALVLSLLVVVSVVVTFLLALLLVFS
jgi:hypothetical protein